MLEQMALSAGDSVLDVGSGNGVLARDLVQAVGVRGRVVGVDPADAMISMSRKFCPEAEFIQGEATDLPLAHGQFDVVTASQVLCFVPDVSAAVAEFYRVLKPGGRVVILDSDWGSLVWHNENQALLQEVIADLTKAYSSAYVPRTLSGKLIESGFSDVHVMAHPLISTKFDEQSYSGQSAAFLPLTEPGGKKLLGDLWLDELRKMDAQNHYFFSLNRVIFSAKKAL